MLKQLLVTTVFVVGLAAQVSGQDTDIPDGEASPGRGVARISVIDGDVSVRRGDSGDLVAAAINSPLVVQDRLSTGPAARAEVQFDWANMLRLSADAEIMLAELQDKRYTVQVARGTVTFRVLRDHDADAELSTPIVSVRPVIKGEYRITALGDGSSEITVRSGEAEVYTPKGSERVKSGRTMLVRGTMAEPELRFTGEIPQDDWDRWNHQRDEALSRSRSYSYVSPDIYGADDLDDHGRWVNVTTYGWVWSPRVASNWAPYRHGRWSWIDYYGWSWVSHDRWGWAPYHYGRWTYAAPHGWCWWPGGSTTRHHWSPALVAFLGFGDVRPGVGFGNIGWVPLAPRERYYPWYGRNYYRGYRDNTYVNNNVRIVNNVNITNAYRNSRIEHAVTVLDQDGFRHGRSGISIRMHDGDFSRVSTFQGRIPITPGRESLRLADREATVRMASGRDSAGFFSRRQRFAVDRIPFEEQRRGMEQITRRTFGEELSRGERTASSGSIGSAALNPGTGDRRGRDSFGRRNEDLSWRRIGELGQTGPDARGARDGTGPNERAFDAIGRTGDDGWRRFGSPRLQTPSSPRVGQPAATGSRGPETTRREAERAQEREAGRRGFNAGASDGAARTDSSAETRGEAERRFDRGWRRGIVSPRVEQPRMERQEPPRMERGSVGPPVVRERPGRSSDPGGARLTPPNSRVNGGARTGSGRGR